jgi:hypothetical protein
VRENMLFDPTLGLAHELEKHIESDLEVAYRAQERRAYWARCPRCERRQVRDNLLTNGCFVCDWQGTEPEIEMARIKQASTSAGAGAMPYRMTCPHCSAQVLTAQYIESGCYICGWRPE